MKYTKPEVAVLGNAVGVIEQLVPVKPQHRFTDTPMQPMVNPAYDLDE